MARGHKDELLPLDGARQSLDHFPGDPGIEASKEGVSTHQHEGTWGRIRDEGDEALRQGGRGGHEGGASIAREVHTSVSGSRHPTCRSDGCKVPRIRHSEYRAVPIEA